MIDLVLDIETTGLLKGPGLGDPYDENTGFLKDDREILEIGYLRVDDDTEEILSSGTLYFYKPYFQIENEAQRIHGLTRGFLKQYEGEFERNLIMLNSLIQKTCIIGKNSTGFDVPYIKGFIDKHGRGQINMNNVVTWTAVKKIDGTGVLNYSPWLYQIDVQDTFRKTWREMYMRKTNQIISAQRKGTLMEYIDILEKQDELDSIYASLDKDRETGAHGALYDSVATYIVWKECRRLGLLRN